MRHIAPFPFKSVAKLSENLLVMLSGSGMSIDIYSNKTNKQLLRLDKKGDFGISCYDQMKAHSGDTHFVVFSDGVDSQVFEFDPVEL